MEKVALLYIPVLHQGYLDFLKKHSKRTDTLYILGNDFIKELMPLHEEIRALKPEKVKEIIDSLGLFEKVQLLEHKNVNDIKEKKIITANESISKKLIAKYYPDANVEYDDVFLRWDESSVYSDSSVNFDRESTDQFDKEMITLASKESEKSSDWWRHVGAVLVKDKKIILGSNNQHVPSEQTPYINGDPRDFIEAGKDSGLSTAIHAEQMLILKAAKENIPLLDTSIYLTVFPCPVCAKFIAYSGIKKCYFSSGHASLDGESVLKANGVELIYVKMEESLLRRTKQV